MAQAVNEQLLTFLESQQPAYISDGIGDNLSTIFRRLNQQFSGSVILGFSQATASKIVSEVGKKNKSKFDRSVKTATGVNLGSVIAEEGLDDFVSLQISKNASLIKSLPEQYLSQVETIVNNGVINGTRYKEIAKQITAKTGSANSKLLGRIKTIAMNEVQTINAQLTQKRTKALGITRGIFRTSEDERVRPCHDELNGKEFEISKGAWSPSCGRFIIPGVTDINCRCSFSPIIEVP